MKKKILLIDDDEDTTGYIVSVLEKTQEFTVTWLRSVDELIRENEKGGIETDLVILDIMMHWGKAYRSDQTSGGFRTGIKLAEDMLLGLNKPLIVLTALTGDGLKEVKDYFDEYKDEGKRIEILSKPCSSIELRYLVGKILSKK